MVELLAGWAALPLRLAIGFIFLYHGYPKIKNLTNTKKMVREIGFVPPLLWATLLAIAEFFGGLGLIAGIMTRIWAGMLIFSMTVATLVKKFVWKKEFEGGYELDILLVAALISLFLLGAGNVSFDSMIGWILG